jgi:Ca2+-binding EF-hand superfamily protein
MKRHTKIALAVLAATIAVGGTAFAVKADYGERRGGHHDKHGARAEWMFERYDANKDGKITKAEIETARKASIAKYDADKDGKLSLEEFQGLFNEIMRHRMVRMFQKLDRDGDAKVTEAEIARKVDRMMSWLDRDNNGEIERGEMGRGRMGHHGGRDDDDDDDRGHRGGYHR